MQGAPPPGAQGSQARWTASRHQRRRSATRPPFREPLRAAQDRAQGRASSYRGGVGARWGRPPHGDKNTDPAAGVEGALTVKYTSTRSDMLGRTIRRATAAALVAGAFWAPAATAQTAPGGPVLVVTNPGDRFGDYYAEILRAEGLNEFAVANVGSLSPALLSSYQVVVLAPAGLSGDQVGTLLELGRRRRKPDRDAAGQRARRPGGPRRRRRRRGRRLHPDQHDLGPRRRAHQRVDAVPRRRRPPRARGRAADRLAAQRREHRRTRAGRDAAQLRRSRWPGRGVHVRPRAVGRLHPPGQPRLGR